jgi:acetyl esterase/lipase
MPWLLLAVGVLALAFAVNALWPRYAPAGLAAVSFFAGWLTAELALHHALAIAIVAGALVYGGALAAWPGSLGLGFAVASTLLLLLSWRRADGTRAVIEAALGDDFDDPDELDDSALRWRQLLLPIPVTHPAVERLRNVVYHEAGPLRLRLDVFRRRGGDYGPGARRPVMLFVHGGAWMIGSKNHHGLPLMHHLAARGWVCYSINYRLSPRATWPDHAVDVKRAIAWVRDHAVEHGGDPGFIVISGGSAGGHLASLAALTANRPELQPGFERADTSVAACVSFYGIYDFTDRYGHWRNEGLQRLLERHVMKSKRRDAREVFAAASPITYIDAKAPPFLVVHGELDSLVPVAEGRKFFAELRAVSEAPCVYFEVPGAQHAFEIFPSPRTLHVLRGVERFTRAMHRRAVASRTASPTSGTA